MPRLTVEVDESLAGQVSAASERHGLDTADLLREALRHHLAWLDGGEQSSLQAISSWGPVADWSDWADATGG